MLNSWAWRLFTTKRAQHFDGFVAHISEADSWPILAVQFVCEQSYE